MPPGGSERLRDGQTRASPAARRHPVPWFHHIGPLDGHNTSAWNCIINRWRWRRRPRGVAEGRARRINSAEQLGRPERHRLGRRTDEVSLGRARVRPVMVPRASGSRRGLPSPTKADECTPPGDAASAADSAAVPR
jgi:hypothetical protein